MDKQSLLSRLTDIGKNIPVEQFDNRRASVICALTDYIGDSDILMAVDEAMSHV